MTWGPAATSSPELLGTDGAALGVAQRVVEDWDVAGLGGSLYARHLRTGAELGFDADRPLPLASLVKLPLALAVLEACAAGLLDEAEPVRVDPTTATRGRTGVGAYAHPSTIALGDLVTSMVALSDNAACDLLFERVPPSRVNEAVATWGIDGLVCRHRIGELHRAASAVADDDVAALELAITAATTGGGHAIAMLDVAAANLGSARGVADLLAGVWSDTLTHPAACARLRRAMAAQLTSRRVVPELASDAVRVASKTGTFLNLRHDAAVIEAEAGPAGSEVVVFVAMTESRVPVLTDPGADIAIGRAARLAFDVLRD